MFDCTEHQPDSVWKRALVHPSASPVALTFRYTYHANTAFAAYVYEALTPVAMQLLQRLHETGDDGVVPVLKDWFLEHGMECAMLHNGPHAHDHIVLSPLDLFRVLPEDSNPYEYVFIPLSSVYRMAAEFKFPERF